MNEKPVCNVISLGLIAYHAAWDIQRELAEARAAGEVDDTLLLLEHPHTYTLGRSADPANLLMSADERARLGVTVVDVDRGGDITYHGPGQLVAYPVRYLGEADASGHLVRADYIGYLRQIEEVVIRTIAVLGIEGRREEGLTGVWVDTPTGPEKIAAIGVRVSASGISTHGTALNVAPDMSYFRGIIPCGIADKPVTSLEKLLGSRTPAMQDVMAAFVDAYAAVFTCATVHTSLPAVRAGAATK